MYQPSHQRRVSFSFSITDNHSTHLPLPEGPLAMPPSTVERTKLRAVPSAEEMKALKPLDQEAISWGLHDLANAIREGTGAISPAAETIHGFGDRLDALCKWFNSKKTLLAWGVLFLVAIYKPDLGAAIGQAVEVLKTAGVGG